MNYKIITQSKKYGVVVVDRAYTHTDHCYEVLWNDICLFREIGHSALVRALAYSKGVIRAFELMQEGSIVL